MTLPPQDHTAFCEWLHQRVRQARAQSPIGAEMTAYTEAVLDLLDMELRDHYRPELLAEFQATKRKDPGREDGEQARKATA